MNDNRSLSAFVAGIASSLSATALVWLLASKYIQTAGLISMLIAAVCIFMYWRERRDKKKITSDCVPFAQRVNGSIYEFRDMVNSANTTIFMVGPNLNFLVKEAWAKDFLFSCMAQRRLAVRFLITNPDSPACQVMNEVAFTPTFQGELDEAIKTFTNWKLEASTKSIDFHAKKADAITLSAVFVDADSLDGRLLVIPIPWKVNGSQRPCFLLKKNIHPEAFNAYYDSYKLLFDNVAIEI